MQNKQNKKDKVINIHAKGDEFQFKDKQVKAVEKFATVWEALDIDAPKYKKGDEFGFEGKQVKIVEVIGYQRYHVKNLNEPFDSFIVLESEIQKENE